jgi:hypothetical protein
MYFLTGTEVPAATERATMTNLIHLVQKNLHCGQPDTQDMLKSAGMRQHTSEYLSIRSIRQHTSAYVAAYVSICQQASAYAAYVSIRQHTSAYRTRKTG